LITLIRYVLSIAIWAVVAIVLLLTGKAVYLMFWLLLGGLLIIVWIGHMIYKIFYLFNPDFKAIKIVVAFLILIAAGIGYFKFFVAPSWNNWNSTQEEIDDKYIADQYCPEAELRTVRTLEVNVPRDYIFRWIRQLPELDSYGSGLFGIGGSKKYDRLIDDLPQLKEGDDFFMGQVADIEPGKSITFNIGEDSKFPKLGIKCFYGGYYLREAGGGKTRINMVMRADYEGFWGWFYSQVIIEFGDFLIATRQLSKLKEIAERNFRE
jgi:hypothetical protein